MDDYIERLPNCDGVDDILMAPRKRIKVEAKVLQSLITEKDIRRVCKDYLQVKGWFVFHLLQGLGCYPGLSDMVAIKGGRVLFIELKRPIGGIHRKPQKKFKADIERSGGEYILVKCLEDLIEGINEGGEK